MTKCRYSVEVNGSYLYNKNLFFYSIFSESDLVKNQNVIDLTKPGL